MSAWQMKIIAAEVERLLALAAEDADLRAELRSLAKEILAATEGPGSEAEDAPTGAPAPQADRSHESEPLRELTLGRSPPSVSDGRIRAVTAASHEPESSVADLPELEARCRRKAEAARWAADCQYRIREEIGAPLEDAPKDRDVVEWADQLTNCFYWVNSADTARPADISLLDDVGGCFEAVAEALSIVREVLDDHGGRRGHLEQALALIAEAQSALRAAIQGINAPDDPDQLEAFEWLKATAARHHVYLKRFMRADDPADSTRWPDLLARIEGLDAKLRRKQGRSLQEGLQLDRLLSHLTTIREGKGTDHDWQEVAKVVDEMVGAGVPPSNREIRELLRPLIDELPERDDLPHGFRLVLREIDRFLATRTPASVAKINQEPTVEVKEARRLLRGRSAVLIGGICRRESQTVLRTALGLKDLIWIETKEHQSISAFEPAIARPDVALILLAIRWSSHAFGDVKQFCDRHGKPLVRLPGGYGPNQVAAQILAQCSEQLGGN